MLVLTGSKQKLRRIKRNMAEFQFQTDELEFVDDYFSATDFDDDDNYDNDNSGVDFGKDDSLGPHFEDDFDLLDIGKSKTDTTAGEARKGKDIQGIPWERLNFTRDKYRETRLKQYKNYHSIPSSSSYDHLHKDCKKVEKVHSFYDFHFNTRLVKSTIVHFQNYSVMHWSAVRKSGKEVLNVAKPISPTAKCPRSFPLPLSRVQISTMSVKDNLLAAGGFHGELICKRLNEPGVAFSTKVTTDENAITNAVDIAESSSGSTWVIAANNDAQVRVFDATNFIRLNCFSFPWSVNNTSTSPDGKLMAVLGDSAECLLSDSNTGKVTSTLKGHLDYSFSSAWHPEGRILATGNQDMTCRLWDIRNTSQSLDVLKGRMGAIRALKFTSDGRFLAMAEPADFVHIFNTRSGYEKAQEIDLFGEIAGISFSPDTEALFVGIADRTYGSVLEFNRSHRRGYLEAVY